MTYKEALKKEQMLLENKKIFYSLPRTKEEITYFEYLYTLSMDEVIKVKNKYSKPKK